MLLSTLFGLFPFLQKLFADSAYQGALFNSNLATILPCLQTEIVKRSDQAKGFVVLPKRWIVERTIAWLNRCRRLAKDFDNLNRNALGFLRFASIRLMLRKLCNPRWQHRGSFCLQSHVATRSLRYGAPRRSSAMTLRGHEATPFLRVRSRQLPIIFGG